MAATGPPAEATSPKGRAKPTWCPGTTTPVPRQSQTFVDNFCSTGPKEEPGMHYRNREVFTPETGDTALLLHIPNNTAGTRGHRLAKTGWDSTSRCVKAIQRALFSFKNYLQRFSKYFSLKQLLKQRTNPSSRSDSSWVSRQPLKRQLLEPGIKA